MCGRKAKAGCCNLYLRSMWCKLLCFRLCGSGRHGTPRLFCTGCNAVLSQSCNGKDQGQSEGKGTNTATTTIFGPCSLCDATSCDGCEKWNPLYLVMLCCNSCGTKVCQQYNEGAGKGAVIHACDRCRRGFCGSCVAECHHCSSKFCHFGLQPM